jgi:glycosyltransferase involved in cell wall biosynthesis
MISVCMATFNGEKYLQKQLKSILSQLSINDEIIISDDGSSDDTLNIIRNIHDNRIKIYSHDKKNVKIYTSYRKFQCVTMNFENALKHASGDYIYLADQDDVWLQKKVNKINALLAEYDFVIHNYKIINLFGDCICERAFNDIPIHNNFIMNILDNKFRGCCIAFRRKCLDFLLPFPKYLIGHDYFIGVLCCCFCNYKYMMEPLIEYRATTESVSAKKKHTIFYSIFIRIQLFFLTGIRVVKFSFHQNKDK